MRSAIIIAIKELLDAVRDRRTLLMITMITFLGMPFMMIILSETMTRYESQVEKKEIWVSGIEHAPILGNYFERQGYHVKQAPVDYENKLQTKELIDPVLVIGDDFQDKMAHGERPVVEIVLDVANQDSRTGVAPLKQLMQGFGNEVATLNLAMRGVSPEVLRVVDVREKQLSRTADSGASLKSMLSMMLMLTMMSAGLYAAIDTSAGERERGSLEPLLMTPVSSWSVTLGKWIAVCTLTKLVVIISLLSIFPTSYFIINETARIMLQFSGKEIFLMLLVLMPLAVTVSALQIAIALNGKTYKEAQARCTIIPVLAPLVTLISMFKQGADPIWYKWVPLIAQNQLMGKILNNEPVSYGDILSPVVTCAIITFLSLYYFSKRLRTILM